jgi:hypothetical protein
VNSLGPFEAESSGGGSPSNQRVGVGIEARLAREIRRDFDDHIRSAFKMGYVDR